MVPEVAEDILLALEASNWIRISFSAAPTRIATIGKNKLVKFLNNMNFFRSNVQFSASLNGWPFYF